MIQIVKFNSKVYAVIPDGLRPLASCAMCAFQNDLTHRCATETWPEEDVEVVDCITGQHHYEEVVA